MEELHYRPYKASFFSGKIGIARMEPQGPNISKDNFLWNNAVLSGLGIEKEVVLKKTMQALQRPEDVIEWCV